MEEMELAIKTVIQEISYAPEVHRLWEAYDEWKRAVNEWKQSHRVVQEMPEVSD
jgi:hypothetical protein